MTMEPNPFAVIVAELLVQLFSTKHLYQSIKVPEKSISYERELDALSRVRNKRPGVRIPYTGSKFIIEQTRPWFLKKKGFSHLTENEIAVGNIKIYCSKCDRIEAHSPQNVTALSNWGEPSSVWNDATTGQSFHLSFLCEGCSERFVEFLLIREGMKIYLSGRWPIETIDVPKVIPRKVSVHYSNSILARNCGQFLGAIFSLRTFVEQYWVSLGIRPVGKRMRGEEMGLAYKGMLPANFKESFPTLLEVYTSLSALIHEAKPDEKALEEAIGKVVEHFEAVKLFKLVLPPPSEEQPSGALPP